MLKKNVHINNAVGSMAGRRQLPSPDCPSSPGKSLLWLPSDPGQADGGAADPPPPLAVLELSLPFSLPWSNCTDPTVLVHWYTGALVHWWAEHSLVRWYLVHWFNCTEALVH